MVTFPFWIIRTTDEVNAPVCNSDARLWKCSKVELADAFIERCEPFADWHIRKLIPEDSMVLIVELNGKRTIEMCLDPGPDGSGTLIRLSDIARAMQKAG